eukprot:495732-Pyramimonas_sp.AAC.1
MKRTCTVLCSSRSAASVLEGWTRAGCMGTLVKPIPLVAPIPSVSSMRWCAAATMSGAACRGTEQSRVSASLVDAASPWEVLDRLR